MQSQQQILQQVLIDASDKKHNFDDTMYEK
jgi:hypothetical protein